MQVQAQWAALWVAQLLVQAQALGPLARQSWEQVQALAQWAEEAEWVPVLEGPEVPGQGWSERWWRVLVQRLGGFQQEAGQWELWQLVAGLWAAASSLCLPQRVQ